MVTGGCKHPVLLPWHILSVHEPEESFNSLFDRVVKPKIHDKLYHQSSEVKLDRCYVGQSKDAVDKTDSSLLVEEVVSAFGPYIIFQSLYHLPDPILSDTESGHYKPFNDVYGKATTEKDLPSKKATATASRRFTLKHVKNANLMLQCEECDLWRLVYSDVKLTPVQKSLLQNALADSVFTCGSSIEDLELELENVVYTQPLNCNEPIEKQYYSAGYKSICVYCACDQSSNSSASYPQCSDCSCTRLSGHRSQD